MRSKLLKAVVVGSLLAIVLGMPLLLASHRIRPSTAARIKTGMTIGDVVEVLNAEPGKYDGYDLSRYGTYLGERNLFWCSRHCWIRVWIDQCDRVVDSEIGTSVPETWLARLSHRLAPPPAIEDPVFGSRPIFRSP